MADDEEAPAPKGIWDAITAFANAAGSFCAGCEGIVKWVAVAIAAACGSGTLLGAIALGWDGSFTFINQGPLLEPNALPGPVWLATFAVAVGLALLGVTGGAIWVAIRGHRKSRARIAELEKGLAVDDAGAPPVDAGTVGDTIEPEAPPPTTPTTATE